MTKKISAIIQARTGSTRLPNKVLAKIEEHPMIWHLVQRLKNSKYKPEIIIATTTSEKDKLILNIAKELNVKSFAGSEDDVLDRYYQTAKKFNTDIIIRITADCPLIDPEVFDKVLEFYLENDYDYVSNTHPPTYPDGLDVEICSFKVLERVWKDAKLTSEREHVTYHIWNNEQKFKLGNVYYSKDESEDLSGLRWTVDEKEDLEFVIEVFKNLYSKKKIFLLNDILELLKEKPELMKINNQYERNEGLLKSLKEDKIIK